MRYNEILTELTGAKKVRKLGIEQVLNFLAENGYKPIGAGEFSYVFAYKDYEIVKLFNDECYEKFINICKAYPNNPHFPKIKGKILRFGPRIKMVRMEKLNFKSHADQHEWEDISDDLLKYMKVPDDDKMMYDLDDSVIQYLQALQILDSELSNRCHFDIHAQNIMFRDDTPVIIDPYASNDDGWGSGVY